MKRKCLVIISPKPVDYGLLITKLGHTDRWRSWEGDTWVVYIAESEPVFNSEVSKKLADCEPICIAHHPSGRPDPLQTSPEMRVKSFSHTNGDPIWSPHGAILVDQLYTTSIGGHPDTPLLNYSIDSIFDVFQDRQTVFRDASIKCLSALTVELLKERPSVDNIEAIVQDELGDTFLTSLTLDPADVQSWLRAMLTLGDEELSKLPLDTRIVHIRELRNILLGGDVERDVGLIDFLKSARSPNSSTDHKDGRDIA